MRVIFLDVDGVLNYAAAFQQRKDLGSDVLDPNCMDALRLLVQETGAKVVLSSTWRLIPDARRTIHLALHLARIPVVGQTPDLSKIGSSSIRGHEISAWLDLDIHSGVTSYVVLDDESDAGVGHEDRFVQTDFENGGLTPELAAKARTILKIGL